MDINFSYTKISSKQDETKTLTLQLQVLNWLIFDKIIKFPMTIAVGIGCCIKENYLLLLRTSHSL